MNEQQIRLEVIQTLIHKVPISDLIDFAKEVTDFVLAQPPKQPDNTHDKAPANIPSMDYSTAAQSSESAS